MFLTRDQVRAVDRHAIEQLGVPSLLLMENAGRGAAELLLRLGVHAPVLICCGPGNNGGDGLVMARHLDNLGVTVKTVLVGDPAQLSADAAVHYRIATLAELPLRTIAPAAANAAWLMQEAQGCEWIVDALFGTGLRGAVRPAYVPLIEAMNASGLRILAVDLPSGLDCDTGQPVGAAVRACHTVTFVAEKIGFQHASAREWLGQVHVVGIGAPREARLLRVV